MYYYRKKTNPVKWVIIIIIIAVLGFVGYWFYQNYFSQIDFSGSETADNQDNNNAENLAKILLSSLSFIQGDVQVKLPDQDWQSAEKNMILHQGDIIKTNAESLAVLNLENESIIRLGQNTEIILSSLAADNLIISQNQGRTYYNLTNITDFELVSLSAKVKSHGSKFELITNQEINYLAVLNFDTNLWVELHDGRGLLLSRRIEAGQKALLDLQKEQPAARLSVEEFTKENLQDEEWYAWNFDLDEKIGLPIEDEEIDQPEDDEPDFVTTDQNLVLSAQAKDNSVFLSWSVYDQADFTNYKIIRSATDNDLKYPGAQVVKTSASSGLNSYVDNSIEAGTTYYYRACVLKDNDKVVCGNVSSVEIEAETEPEEEPEEETEDTTAPASPGLSAAISASGVSLSWSASQASDFSHYVVLRSMNNANPNYPDEQLSSTGIASFLDNSVNITSVGNYYYRVCAFDQSDNFNCSNSVIIENGQVK